MGGYCVGVVVGIDLEGMGLGSLDQIVVEGHSGTADHCAGIEVEEDFVGIVEARAQTEEEGRSGIEGALVGIGEGRG